MIYYCSNNEDFISTLNIIENGDTIILKSGVYAFNKCLNIRKSDITIKGNHNVVFDFKDIPYFNKTKTNGNGINFYSNNSTLSNISIRYAAYCGLDVWGQYNNFYNIETSYNCDCGFRLHNGGNHIENCVSHHNCDYRLYKFNTLKYGFNSDGFGDKLISCNGNNYINCVSHDNGDDGFDFFQRETSYMQTTMKFCQAYNNGNSTIDLSKNERLLADLEYKDRYDLKRYPNYGCGVGFKLGGIHTRTKEINPNYINKHNITIENSVSYNNTEGFAQNHNSGNINLINCISTNNRKTNYYFIDKQYKCTLNMENCKSIPTDHVMIN